MNIEKYLILNKYILSLFGVSEFKELQEKLKDARTGYDSDGRSNFVNVLRSSFENLKISEDELLEYDKNIQSFIISKTPYQKLIEGLKVAPSKQDYKKHHVLFLEKKDWVKDFFEILVFNVAQAQNTK